MPGLCSSSARAKELFKVLGWDFWVEEKKNIKKSVKLYKNILFTEKDNKKPLLYYYYKSSSQLIKNAAPLRFRIYSKNKSLSNDYHSV